MDAWSVFRSWIALAGCCAALLCAGCDKPPPTVESFVPPPLGTTWTLKTEATGSLGSGTTFATIERGQRTWNGQPVIAYDRVEYTTLANERNETIALTVGDVPSMIIDPPIGLAWPLHVGGTHKSAHRITTQWNGLTQPFEFSYRVEAYEDVTVPAGTFKAFRIRTTDSRGEEGTRWFSPERGFDVKRSVSRIESFPDGPGTLTYELVPPRAARMPRVGLLWEGFVVGGSPQLFFESTLGKGLRELGWINGQNVLFVHRFNRDSTEEQGARNVEDLIRLKVDVIVDGSGVMPARMTKTIPIVTLYCPDPVGLGVADSYARPGRNVTGMAVFLDETESSSGRLSLELLFETVPSARKIGLILPPRAGIDTWKVFPAFARVLQLHNAEVFEFTIRSLEDIDKAFEEMRRVGVQAIWIEPVTSVMSRELPRVAALAVANRMPLFGFLPSVAVQGGLIGASYDFEYNNERAATYVDRILRGARPGDLPFEQPTKVRIAVNLKTARALGLTLPKALIARADQVIE